MRTRRTVNQKSRVLSWSICALTLAVLTGCILPCPAHHGAHGRGSRNGPRRQHACPDPGGEGLLPAVPRSVMHYQRHRALSTPCHPQFSLGVHRCRRTLRLAQTARPTCLPRGHPLRVLGRGPWRGGKRVCGQRPSPANALTRNGGALETHQVIKVPNEAFKSPESGAP